MAIEAHQHFNVFSPQLLPNRDCVKLQRNMNQNDFNHVFSNGEVPMINNGGGVESSGLTYNFNTPSSVLKRPRDENAAQYPSAVKRNCVAFGLPVPSPAPSPSSSLLNAEFVTQIQRQQQAEIDRFVALQTEKLRREIEARQQTQTRILAFTVQNMVAKKLKEKDDELFRIRNLNWVLQERVKSLYVENQIWRDLAQTNEANANTLRSNLEQVLAQTTLPNAVEQDAESSCGSCDAEEGINNNKAKAVAAVNGVCRKCGEKEASVLVLPCRHLCLCSGCGSALLTNCPVCDAVMNASVHVNMSS